MSFQEEIRHRKSIIALMVKMIKADGQIDDLEKQFVYDIAFQLDLTPDDVIDVVKNLNTFEVKPPPPEQDRMSILYYLLFTMAVDGKIDKAEEDLCYKAGLRLGFNEHLTRDLINVMKKNLNQQIPKEALLKQVRKHLN